MQQLQDGKPMKRKNQTKVILTVPIQKKWKTNKNEQS